MNNGHQFVGEVIKKEYRIPKYQRGYRWTEDNVTKLLEDIYEDRLYKHNQDDILDENTAYNVFYPITFDMPEDKPIFSIPKSPYCIQPLVLVKAKNEDYYDVIDGQQRLTTIAIIRAALNNIENYTKEQTKIFYESRKTSGRFLEYLDNNQNKPVGENIDYAYMQQAFAVSQEYFNCLLGGNKFEDSVRNKYAKYLDDVLCKNTQFIWYQVNGENPQKVFANFNTGKIELTNAELIKALFMNPSNYDTTNIKDKQIVISEKWDEIENKLHEPDFWAFVPHPNQYEVNHRQYSTRIDILFDFLVMDIWLDDNLSKSVNDYIIYRNGKSSDKYIFNEIETWIMNELSHCSDQDEVMDKCWRRIGKIFSGLKELYSGDNNIYNMTGLYINLCNRRTENVDEFEVNNNSTYLNVYYHLNKVLNEPRNLRVCRIKELIKRKVFNTSKSVEEVIKGIKYNEGITSDIIKILLVYNIALLSTSKGTGERFNFLANASNKWEREHIFASNVKLEASDEEFKIALKMLSGDDYINYVRYLFDIDQPINFRYEGIEFVLDTSKIGDIDTAVIDNFINANLVYDGNSKFQMLARALSMQKRARDINNCYENLSDIDYILDERDDLREMLAYRYLNNFEGRFHFYENIDFVLSKDFKTTIELASSSDIVFKSYEYTYNFRDYNKDDWKNWLLTMNEDDDKSNYVDLSEKIRSSYQSRLESILYRKSDDKTQLNDRNSIFDKNSSFIYAALKLNRITLSNKIEKFFEDEFKRLLKDNHMGNMTLLTGNKKRNGVDLDRNSRGQNQSVGDKPYSKKKQMVYDFYKKGQFVPIGTLFVFTDLYTKGIRAANLWLPNSRMKYLKDVVSTIQDFVGE
ncbi:MAG: DUF262 domain-containing protein [Clostridiales bacterium]|nr:DUF262 domain-containing protein [Clostridiales bacterium]